MTDEIDFTLKVLRLQPGDLVVCETAKPVTVDQADAICKRLESKLPEGVRVLVLVGGAVMQFSIGIGIMDDSGEPLPPINEQNPGEERYAEATQ